MGEFAYFNFAVEIPAYDQFVPAGLPVAVGGNRDEADANARKPLPPSMVVQPKLAVRPRAYSEHPIQLVQPIPSRLRSTDWLLGFGVS